MEGKEEGRKKRGRREGGRKKRREEGGRVGGREKKERGGREGGRREERGREDKEESVGRESSGWVRGNKHSLVGQTRVVRVLSSLTPWIKTWQLVTF